MLLVSAAPPVVAGGAVAQLQRAAVDRRCSAVRVCSGQCQRPLPTLIKASTPEVLLI